jgi:hypothetical protein
VPNHWKGPNPFFAACLILLNKIGGPFFLWNDLKKSEGIFPAKLHRMLENAKRDRLEHNVSWIQCGTAFKVQDTNKFG